MGIMTLRDEKISPLERISFRITNWIGTTSSILTHTIFFAACFALTWLGYDFEKILLTLTTVVSLEAIYLAIFIQMTVNRNTRSLEEVEEDIDDIQDEMEELGDDVEEISEEVEEISEDVEDITEELHEDDAKEEAEDARDRAAFEKIERDLQKLLSDIEALKNQKG